MDDFVKDRMRLITLIFTFFFYSYANAFVPLAEHRDKNYPPKDNVFVSFNGVCGEIIAINVLIKGQKGVSFYWNIIDDLLEEAVPKVLSLCPQTTVIHGAVNAPYPPIKERNNPDFKKADTFLLEKTKKWKRYPGFNLDKHIGKRSKLSFKSMPDFSDNIVFMENGLLNGRYGKFYLNHFEGKISEYDKSPNLQNVIYISGYWYDIESPQGACAEPKNGYAYWGSFDVKLTNSASTSVRPNSKACAELMEPGQSIEKTWLRTEKSNSFPTDLNTLIFAGSPNFDNAPDIDKKITPLYVKGDIEIFAAKTAWCGHSTYLNLVFNSDEAQMQRIIDRDFDQFFDSVVDPLLLKNCPASQIVYIDVFRTDEKERWVTLLFNAQQILRTKSFNLKDVEYSNIAGESLYNTKCMSCHSYSAGGAPSFGENSLANVSRETLEKLVNNAVNNTVDHFSLYDQDLESILGLVRYMDRRPRKLGVEAAVNLPPYQRTLNYYANNRSAKTLLTSGLLPKGELINSIYYGDFNYVHDTDAVKDLFFDFIQLYSFRCNNFLPVNRKTFVHKERMQVAYEVGVENDVATFADMAINTVQMDAKYYPFYNSIAAEYNNHVKGMGPLNSTGFDRYYDLPTTGLILQVAKKLQRKGALERTKDTRAILGNNEYCASPDTQVYIENLWLFLTQSGNSTSQKSQQKSRLMMEKRNNSQ
jgi:hypothetical protein